MHKKLMMACMAIAAFAAFVIAPAASASPVLTHSSTSVPVGAKIIAAKFGELCSQGQTVWSYRAATRF